MSIISLFKSAQRRIQTTLLISITLITVPPAWATEPSPSLELPEATISTVATGLAQPWAMAFLPNGDILITERAGALRIISNGELMPQPVSGVPAVYFAGQGGLLDVYVDQDFSQNNTIYLSYAHGVAGANATQLISGELKNGSLVNQNTLFTGSPMRATPHHYAGRIGQLNDGSLLLTVGDGYNYREQAQQLNSHLGKIVRVDRQGGAPADNPFINDAKAKPEIWSLGHRNHQGLVVVNDRVFANEHGPQGGDEVNEIKSGNNYGWPVITRGIDYTGARISPFTDYPEMQQPLIDWTPSIAPSSLTYHQGYLYSTSLVEGSVRRIQIDNDKLIDQGVVFPQLNERLRDIASGTDGNLYVLTDGADARLLKIEVIQ